MYFKALCFLFYVIDRDVKMCSTIVFLNSHNSTNISHYIDCLNHLRHFLVNIYYIIYNIHTFSSVLVDNTILVRHPRIHDNQVNERLNIHACCEFSNLLWFLRREIKGPLTDQLCGPRSPQGGQRECDLQ